MTCITFEERAVAFVDVLGFKTIVANAVSDPTALEKLQNLVDLLSGAVPTFDSTVNSSLPAHLIPRHSYISDCIILSAPFSDSEMKTYNGLAVLVMRVIQLTHHFLNEGYLLRGGLTVGKVWHTDTNIVGPAYQDAYLLEKNGDSPCVVLSSAAEENWNECLVNGSRMCVRKEHPKRCFFTRREAPLIVNGLHDFYIPQNTDHGAIETRYEKYSQITKQHLESHLPKSAKNKWRWFKHYLKAESSEGGKWATA